MQAVANTLSDWVQWHLEGFVAFPVTWYVVKNFGAVILTDVQSLWTTYVSKKAAPVIVAPVTNG